MSNLVHPAKSFKSNRYLIYRRLSQLLVFLLFLSGPLFNVWILKGNLASSKLLDTVPFTEPFWFVQSLLTGTLPILTGFLGVVILTTFYLIVGGRFFCSWVCPINIVTDTAHYLREKIGIKNNLSIPKNTRMYLLASIFLVTAITQSVFYEALNPVHIVQRAIIYLSLSSLWAVVIIFSLDLFISKRAWCSHLCPMGAFYSLLNHKSLLKVNTPKRNNCDFCMDCVKVCPEPQIIMPVLKDKNIKPVISSSQCTNCARCVDVCHEEVFKLTIKKDTTKY